MSSTELVVWGLVAHLVADWLLQTDWMAQNKASLAHPAAWVHGAIHAGALSLVFGWGAAVVIGMSHILIDTRRPLGFYRKHMRIQGTEATALHVAVWVDQVAHVAIIAAAALATTGAA